MDRLTWMIAALLAAPAAALGADAPAQPPASTLAQADAAQRQASAQPDAAPAGPDVDAMEGQLTSLAEQYAETKAAVSALQRLKLSGYVQGRFASNENTVYEAGAPSNANFFVRRGRFKATYDTDWALYAVQLDATPAGVGVKEAFAELKLPWSRENALAIDAGLQLLPFGYEVGVRSSADLDLLERSRAARAFLAGEYDLGVSLRGVYGPVAFRAGVFNGNGVEGGGGRDNDQRKDFIGRIGFDLGMVTGGVSGWYGKGVDYTSDDNARFDRWRTGADVQVFLDLLPIGGTTVKGELIWGRSFLAKEHGGAGTALGQLALGWNAILTQNVGRWNAVSVRYDVWTPDVRIDEAANPAKVFRQDEIAAALHTYLGGNLKVSLAYYHPMNGDAGPEAPDDPKSDQYVAQLQAKF